MTPRQVEILELVSSGLIDKEIAQRLGITHGAVRRNLERVRGPFGNRRRVAMATAWLLSDECSPEARERVRRRLLRRVP